mmetsp:Transcript_2773/g.5485  ORF Transcript_2773/g.5485 Transcript_2773/m.5485 type:complete len:318 (-) Transcript_2773:579-1532(-)
MKIGKIVRIPKDTSIRSGHLKSFTGGDTTFTSTVVVKIAPHGMVSHVVSRWILSVPIGGIIILVIANPDVIGYMFGNWFYHGHPSIPLMGGTLGVTEIPKMMYHANRRDFLGHDCSGPRGSLEPSIQGTPLIGIDEVGKGIDGGVILPRSRGKRGRFGPRDTLSMLGPRLVNILCVGLQICQEDGMQESGRLKFPRTRLIGWSHAHVRRLVRGRGSGHMSINPFGSVRHIRVGDNGSPLSRSKLNRHLCRVMRQGQMQIGGTGHGLECIDPWRCHQHFPFGIVQYKLTRFLAMGGGKIGNVPTIVVIVQCYGFFARR